MPDMLKAPAFSQAGLVDPLAIFGPAWAKGRDGDRGGIGRWAGEYPQCRRGYAGWQCISAAENKT